MRIYVTGSSASGKTTYCRRNFGNSGLVVHHTDDLYKKYFKGDKNREEFHKLVPLDGDWIIEGSYCMPEYLKAAV